MLTMKELLGTWQENAARFAAGQTVVGVVRSVESYGVFIELAPNLAGLAEPDDTLAPGQLVSVYIKSICPQRMKVKLAVTQVLEEAGLRLPLRRFFQGSHMDAWCYSTPESTKRMETVFA